MGGCLKKPADVLSDRMSFSINKRKPSLLRRGAVSSQVFTEAEIANYKRKIIPKDASVMVSLKKAIDSNILFDHLDEAQRAEIFDAMFPVTKDAGDVVIKQGDMGDNFYVIHSGCVHCFVNDVKVGSIPSGGNFGELALIHGTPRAATVIAVTDLNLWAIDRDTYRYLLMGAAMRKRNLYQGLLGKVEILKNLEPWELLTLADALKEVSFLDKEVVVQQGDAGHEFFIVVEGHAKALLTLDSSPPMTLKEYGPSDYFGELSLLFDQPRAATIIADGPLKLVKVDRELFEKIMGPCRDIMERKVKDYKPVPTPTPSPAPI